MAMRIHHGPEITDRDFSLLGHDAETGDTVWIRFNDDGSFVIRHDQDVERLIRQNVEAEKETYGKRFGDWNRFGSVPDAIAQESGLDQAWEQRDMKWVKRWFNDPDNKKFRTSRGTV